MLKTKTITKKYILEVSAIKDVFTRQAKINEIVIAFADNAVQFASSDGWTEYYELIHKKTNLSHQMRKKAFFNAYDSQLNVGR